MGGGLLHHCEHKFLALTVLTEGSTSLFVEKIIACLGGGHSQIICSNDYKINISSLSMMSSRAFWKVSSPAVQSTGATT